jgi:F-type H+-transporting ATPase subunit delta
MKTNQKTRREARHLFRLCLVDGLLDDERARQAAQRLAWSHRRGALPLLSEFQRLVRLHMDRRMAVIESATALAPPLRTNIQADLARRYGPGLEASFSENSALIAGIRIKVGSDVYDGTVRARLAALQARL